MMRVCRAARTVGLLAVMVVVLTAAPASPHPAAKASIGDRLLAAGMHRATAAELGVPRLPTDTIVYCSGYGTIADHLTGGGNHYELTENQCLGHSSGDPNYWQSVSRAACWRNSVTWDGCRVDTTVAMQSAIGGTGFTTDAPSNSWHYPIGSYFADSGRFYGTFIFYDSAGQWSLRSAENWSGVVRFLLADGTTALEPMGTRLSGVANW